VPGPCVAAVDLSDAREPSVSFTLIGVAPVIDVAYYDPLAEVALAGPPPAQVQLSDPLDPGQPRQRNERERSVPRFLALLA
jgi:hypothetical protein